MAPSLRAWRLSASGAPLRPHGQGRSSGPNAPGRSDDSATGPASVSTCKDAPPASHSSWRQRPHGVSGSPVAPSTHTKATSRPPPDPCNADTRPHSAHNVRPYDAFSTLQPVTTRPSSTSAAAPTCKREYGAYARAATSRAAARSRSHPRALTAASPRPLLRLAVGRGRDRAPDCPGDHDDRHDVRQRLPELARDREVADLDAEDLEASPERAREAEEHGARERAPRPPLA